ncbi:hypothetical protein XENOCAPTIV_017408 [Xenoophorus captivus]|uniref:Secreted protein n=1 Tax=Xenoophorus captivus TaxID=1517983 RepID=A0ABV0SHV9_9TELE
MFLHHCFQAQAVSLLLLFFWGVFLTKMFYKIENCPHNLRVLQSQGLHRAVANSRDVSCWSSVWVLCRRDISLSVSVNGFRSRSQETTARSFSCYYCFSKKRKKKSYITKKQRHSKQRHNPLQNAHRYALFFYMNYLRRNPIKGDRLLTSLKYLFFDCKERRISLN